MVICLIARALRRFDEIIVYGECCIVCCYAPEQFASRNLLYILHIEMTQTSAQAHQLYKNSIAVAVAPSNNKF